MTSPSALAAALHAHARGLYCDEAAAELLIAQSWLRRPDFASQFITVHPGIPDGQPMAVVDWAAAVAALGTSMPSSEGEQRMLRITASMGGGIPVDLRDTLTGIDDQNVQLLLRAVRHASGSGHQTIYIDDRL
jgi:hypothetical protein